MSRVLLQFFLQLFLILFTVSISYSSDFKNCKPDLSDFGKFKSELINCYLENDINLDENIESSLLKEATNFFSYDPLKKEELILSEKIIISKEFDKYLTSIIKEYYLYIFGIHLELNSLKIKHNISDSNYDKLIQTSLIEFANSYLNKNKNKNINDVFFGFIPMVVLADKLISNTDDPTVTLTTSSSSIAENGSSITLTATLSSTTSEDVIISFSSSGTGIEGTDYSNISDITITAGNTTGTTSFTPTDDDIYEGDESAIIAIDTVSGGSATEDGDQSVNITITENESAPTLTLTSSASSIAEHSGSSLTLTATLSGATSEDVTVALAISGTATSETDYSALSNMTITSGQTTTTASFTPTDDNIYEGNETAIIDVDSVSGGSATESGTQQLTLTISDNESAPTVTLTSSASSVSEDGSAITLTATLSNATTADVTVTLSTGGTATEGTDYANLSDITVSAGDTTGTTSLTPTNDSTFEGDETITIDIDTVSGGSATENGTQQVSITFQEDDAGPTLTIADVITADESAAKLIPSLVKQCSHESSDVRKISITVIKRVAKECPEIIQARLSEVVPALLTAVQGR